MSDSDEPVQLPIQGTLIVSKELLTALLREALDQSREVLAAMVTAELANHLRLEPRTPRGTMQEWPFMPSDFGHILRQRREQQGLTRAQLAAISGVADSTIRNIEVRRHRPTSRSRTLLTEAFKALPRDVKLD